DTLKDRHIALWGLAFKANTDDVRESPALDVVRFLLDAGADVTAYDPQAMDSARRIFRDGIRYASDCYDALKKADGLVVATEWNEFRRPDFDQMLELMGSPVIFDGRNLFDPERMRERGFKYYGVGRI
ncbi:MAG TPA: UDP-glucose 6-dehydrogenase, partial [Bacteroidetes bacterium]|nr:UDP-glucose 6-dehydrogenase [Bacteroidota bacterium]